MNEASNLQLAIAISQLFSVAKSVVNAPILIKIKRQSALAEVQHFVASTFH